MKQKARRLRAGFISDQSGNALILVLIFLLLGSLTLVPAMAQVSTALKTGVRYEKKTDALYAADSGVEDGIWQIKYDGLQTKFGNEPSYNYMFTTNASYSLSSDINRLATNVTIQNIWIPSDVTLDSLGLTADDAKTLIDSEKLVVSGSAGVSKGDPYRIKIDFVPATGDNLTIKSVGVWLPQNFTYTMGSSSLEAVGHTYTKIPTVASHSGGTAIVWTYSPPYPLFDTFPSYTSVNGTNTSKIEFRYTPPVYDNTRMPAAISWVTTEMHDSAGNPKMNPNSPANVPVSWDVGTRIYKINSEAGGTRIEAYSSRRETRNLDEAMSGDYVAIGNSLMIGDVTKRDNLLTSSNTTVDTIPVDADAIAAYLYWSGFRHDLQPLADNCTSANFTGTWTNAGDWSYYSTGGNYRAQHTGASDSSRYLTQTVGKDISIYPSGTEYEISWAQSFTTVSAITVFSDDCGSSNNLTDSWQQTGSDWIHDSGSGARYRGQHLGADSATKALTMKNGLNLSSYNYGTITVSWSQSESGTQSASDGLDYAYSLDNGVTWSSNQTVFRNDNPSGSYSHTFSSQNLTGVNFKLRLIVAGMGTSSQYVNLDNIEITVTPAYTATDGLDFALYDGSSWSSNIQAFRGPGNPTSSFSYAIPGGYVNSNFKMRFYLVGCNSPGMYVNIDTIRISVRPPDTQVTFKINETQVYLDGSGNPQEGVQPLTASSASVLVNTGGVSTEPGFSYACHLDVSKLVKKYPVVVGETHHTGNANYRVGDVQANIKEYVSYAGWSLIIVYWSPKIAGHYLYLRDVFGFNPGSTNLDFDGDGQPGGDITDFIIPEPIRNSAGVITETVAANITCFVGEGDGIYTGDTLMITGATSHNSTYLWNGTSKNDPNYPYNNVWNGASPGCSYPGVDVDTFQVLWSQDILRPNDTRFHLDMNSGTDAWNLVYIIVSVRSKTTIGGTEHYIIMDE